MSLNMRNINTEKFKKRINELGENAVFIANDFLDIAEYETVRKALNRLSDEGKIQKILRGVYYRPRYSELLQEYEAPSPHQTAMAIARKFNWNIAPSGTTALNMLGLSTQVPAKWSYISDGTYNSFHLENITIEFKRRNNREIGGMSYKTALIIQGIKALGKGNVDSTAIEKIRNTLTEDEKLTLLNEAKPTTVWIYQVIRKICERS
jgi:predicted transcriptional regulator of viral defense system